MFLRTSRAIAPPSRLFSSQSISSRSTSTMTSLPSHLYPPHLPISPTIYHPSPSAPTKTLLFLIPGNPGLIPYYTSFLSALSASSPATTAVLGSSHLGYNTLPPHDHLRSSTPSLSKASNYYDLDAQIEHKLELLRWFCRSLKEEQDVSAYGTGSVHTEIGEVRRSKRIATQTPPRSRASTPPFATSPSTQLAGGFFGRKREGIDVVLIGHSVGSWIGMKVLEGIMGMRPREREACGIRSVRAGVWLFPTITNIANSPSGRSFVRLNTLIPGLATWLWLWCWVVVTVLPRVWLVGLVKLCTGMSRENSETTVEGLVDVKRARSWEGVDAVRQSVRMAREEMRRIGGDTFPESLWNDDGVEMLFYFARGDNWVGEMEREALMKRRGVKVVERIGGEEGGAEEVIVEEGPLAGEKGTLAGAVGGKRHQMWVCKEGIPHGFCLEHGEVMAGKVVKWVEGLEKE
ncbi:hypothetical protein BJ508DRAFT_48198 [Ascobolus immersus RN42]|uniref:AB hydrolase-1 domain-containing protein n=1 Tax=Ascobolus immersus RN42 TaxID=1160509 RepID=A0A3N4HHY3_ASCIM|nr:hypothetical protein BJ508DRAFT_48198 [Ascobolus immersus RN42]